ncbi:unnamed protein product [Moneuplotes crassus]|uniref:Uncharacterized protein n=2 Tax=Euplotes crassus TaxID=5936 RepID=A0AAD2D4Z4_EUPCR|nr:unnamed protein product [Moneuplotes crassus]
MINEEEKQEYKSMKYSTSQAGLSQSKKQSIEFTRHKPNMRSTTKISQYSGSKMRKRKKIKAIPFLNQTPIKIRPYSSNQKDLSDSKSLSKFRAEKNIFSHVPKPKKGKEPINSKYKTKSMKIKANIKAHQSNSSNNSEVDNPVRKLVYASSDMNHLHMMSSPDPFSGNQKTFETYNENPLHEKFRSKRIGSAAPIQSPFKNKDSGVFCNPRKKSCMVKSDKTLERSGIPKSTPYKKAKDVLSQGPNFSDVDQNDYYVEEVPDSRLPHEYMNSDFIKGLMTLSPSHGFQDDDDSLNLLQEVDKLIEDDNQNYIKENIFGNRARSEQRTLETFNSPTYSNETKDRHFAMSQNKFNEEKKAREMLNSFMNKMTPLSISESSLNSYSNDEYDMFSKNSKTHDIRTTHQLKNMKAPKSEEREDSINHAYNPNDSINGACITGNFGGTFSNFKIESKRGFSSFRCTKSIEKLIKKFDIDIRSSIPNSIKPSSKDIKSHKGNSSVIQSQLVVFEEEKRMREEKQHISDSINKIFRMYEKVYNKVFKKHAVKGEFSNAKKDNPKYTRVLQVFHNINKMICQYNPSHSISLIKLWKHNEKINEAVHNSITEERRKYTEHINQHFNGILLECNNIFSLLDSRNQDILSLVEYTAEMKEVIEQMNKSLEQKEKKLAEYDNLKHKIQEFLPNFEIYCDHMAVLQDNPPMPIPMDKSLDSSTQTEPRNSQSGYIKKLFQQDCEKLVKKSEIESSRADSHKEEYEHIIQDLRAQIKLLQEDDSINKFTSAKDKGIKKCTSDSLRNNATIVPKLNIDLNEELEEGKCSSYRRKDIIHLRRKPDELSNSGKKESNRSHTTTENQSSSLNSSQHLKSSKRPKRVIVKKKLKKGGMSTLLKRKFD